MGGARCFVGMGGRVEARAPLTAVCRPPQENIVAYYGAFIKSKTMWICMEFCGGGSVSDMYNCAWGAALPLLVVAGRAY